MRTRIRTARGGVAPLLLPLLLTAGAAACAGGSGDPPELGGIATVAERGASNPTVALDPRTGRSYVAWVGSEEGISNVYLAVAEPGASFAGPVRVNDLPGDAAPHEQAPAQVAVGPEGNVYVLWQNSTPVEGRRFPASDLRLAVSTDGGSSFRPAITVNDDAGEVPSSHTFHDVAVGADGSVYVSWIDSRVRDRLRAAAAAADPGAAHHVHAGEEGPGPEIRIARSDDGGRSFGPSAVVDSEACPCCRTSLALGPDGSVYVAWRKVYAGDVRDVVVARAEPGALDFGEPVRVHEDGWVFPGCPHAGPSVAVGGDGRVHVGWYTGREDRQGLWYAVSSDGGRSYGAPEPLLTGDWVPPSQVRLATAAPGEVWMAWDDRTGETGTLALARLRGAGAPGVVRDADAAGKAPALAAAGGAAVVAWLDGEALRVRRLGGGE